MAKQTESLRISTTYLEHGYDPLEISEGKSTQGHFGLTLENMNRCGRCLTGFYGLFEIPKKFAEKTERTKTFQSHVWQDYVSTVAKGKTKKHRLKIIYIPERIQKARH